MTPVQRSESVGKTASRQFVAAAKRPARAPRQAPFSLRLSAEERVRLEELAAGEPLGAFIKAQVFESDSLAVPRCPRRRRAAVKDHAALAQVLGMLGNLRLASNLNQLAKAANLGVLPLSPEVEEELSAACAAVFAIKAEVMRALGYEGGGDR